LSAKKGGGMTKREDLTPYLIEVIKDKERKIKELKEEIRALSFLIKKERREFRHFQKKIEREEEKRKLSQRGEIISSLLNILDSFEGAKINFKDEKLRKGLELIEKQFIDFLKNEGVEEIGKTGESFNPHIHQVVSIDLTNDEEKDGKISAVLRKGYKIGDLLLRPAYVKVYKKEVN